MPRPTTTSALACALLSFAATAQTTIVSYRDDAFPNTTGLGTPLLACRVFYPALSPSPGAPIAPSATGYPVILHLHGAGGNGRATGEMSTAIASAGYVLVMQDTATSSSTTQYNDALATIPALQVANTTSGSFWRGQLDLSRFALQGHSMGGGNTFKVLALRSEFKAGVTFASTNSSTSAPNVKVPMLLVAGQGDTVINHQTSINLYNGLSQYTRTKTLYLFNSLSNHATMIGNPVTANDRLIFDRTMVVVRGYYATVLKGDPRGFEQVVGAAARAEPNLAQLHCAAETPVLWTLSAGGAPTVMQAFAEPGAAFLAYSLRSAQVPTIYGLLGLDPEAMVVAPFTIGSTKVASIPLGLPLGLLPGGAFQLAGVTRLPLPRLSNVISLESHAE